MLSRISNIFDGKHKLESLNPDMKIFKFLDERFFWRLINTKEMLFRLPSDWEDPCENILKNINSEGETGLRYCKYIGKIYDETVFGTCWTYCYDTDAMWRIYSPQKTGVCIQTTPNKLFKSIAFEKNCEVIMKPVEYGVERAIEELKKKDEWDVVIEGNEFASFFQKRMAFEHEKEIRLLIRILDREDIKYNQPEDYTKIRRVMEEVGNKEKNKAIYISFDNLDFIEQVIVDPRTKKDDFNFFQRALEREGIASIKSTLYDISNDSIKENVIKEEEIKNEKKYYWDEKQKKFLEI